MDSWLGFFYGNSNLRPANEENFNENDYFAEDLKACQKASAKRMDMKTVKGFTATEGDGVWGNPDICVFMQVVERVVFKLKVLAVR